MINNLIKDNRINIILLVINTILLLYIIYFIVICHVGVVNYASYAYYTAFNIFNKVTSFYVYYQESILKKIIFSILNILIVMPLSFLVLACFDKYKSKIKYIITLLIVNIFFLILELIQYFCHIGVFELIDSLMYLIGSVIAILIYINLRNKINELNINKILFVTMFILFILSVLSIYPTIRQAEAIKYQYNLLK